VACTGGRQQWPTSQEGTWHPGGGFGGGGEVGGGRRWVVRVKALTWLGGRRFLELLIVACPALNPTHDDEAQGGGAL
jgi:hypothetical protein